MTHLRKLTLDEIVRRNYTESTHACLHSCHRGFRRLFPPLPPISSDRIKFASTRLTCFAIGSSPTTASKRGSARSLGQYLDVVSCNEYIGWYDGMPEKIDRTEWKVAFDKPFVLSEFGADAQAGRHGDAGERWTEEYQADVYRRQVAMFQRTAFLSGTIAWVLVDFRSPRRPLAGVQDYFKPQGALFRSRRSQGGILYFARLLPVAGRGRKARMSGTI